MSEVENKYLRSFLSIGKTVIAIVSGTILSFIWLGNFIDKKIDAAFDKATINLVSDIEELQKKFEKYEPIFITDHEVLSLIRYRMDRAEDGIKSIIGNNEAIIPNGYQSPKDPRKFKEDE